jgi:hypothetical protein
MLVTTPKFGRHHSSSGQFAGMIGAGFQHGRLMSALQAQQGQGHAHIIVETGFAPEGRLFLAQNRGDQFLGRGLAVGTAHGHHRQLEFAPVGGSQSDPRRAGCVNQNGRAGVETRGSLFRSATTAAAPRCRLDKKAWPSKRSPDKGRNKSPGSTWRESVQMAR